MPTFECPVCAKSITVQRAKDAPFRPFCCQRCKLVDLGRWLDGTYRVSESIPLNELEKNLPGTDAPEDETS